MKTHSLSALIGGLLALIATLVLTSCGGGGASTQPIGGTVQILPKTATIYAGVPTTFQVLGGRPPYQIASSEATILPVPSQIDGHSFTVVPNNPGVVDTGIGPGDLPVRSVTINVRGNDGSSDDSSVKVAQNFLTGYGVTFTQQSCPSGAPIPTTPPSGNFACNGGETAAIFAATTDATRRGDAAFNVSIIYGNASLINPATGQTGQTVQAVSDHTGTVTVLVHVNAGTPTSLGVIRIQEATTGVYADHVFVITGNNNATSLTAIPSTFSFTGATSAQCGTGSGTFEVFDGAPPYTAVSSNPGFLSVTPATSNKQPGVFTLTAGDPNTCGNASIIVTDETGAHVEVKVTTAAGTVAPPVLPTPIQVSPSTLTLTCGSSASASIAGGAGGTATFSASSPNPNITATVSGSTVTVTRLNSGTASASTAITISDGTAFGTLTVNSPTTCP